MGTLRDVHGNNLLVCLSFLARCSSLLTPTTLVHRANIGRVVFAASNDTLMALTGARESRLRSAATVTDTA